MSIDNTILLRIEIIVDRICKYADKIVLYGSQTIVSSLNSDIDLLVLTDKSYSNYIYNTISDLQVEFSQIIHAVLITENDLEINVDLCEIFQNGLIVWDKNAVNQANPADVKYNAADLHRYGFNN